MMANAFINVNKYNLKSYDLNMPVCFEATHQKSTNAFNYCVKNIDDSLGTTQMFVQS